MKTPDERLKLKNNVDSTNLNRAVQEYQVPAKHEIDGVKSPVSIVALVDPTLNPIPFVRTGRPWENGIPTWTLDATLNNSNKTFTVPRGKCWLVRGLWIEITTTATVGNRLLNGRIFNATPAAIWSFEPTGSIIASNVGRWNAGIGCARTAATGTSLGGVAENTALQVALPDNLILTEGFSIRLWDQAAIDAAQDDTLCSLNYLEYDV
jgi:hypothetical protein